MCNTWEPAFSAGTCYGIDDEYMAHHEMAYERRPTSGVYPDVSQPALVALRRVPEITVIFWIIKLLSTAMEESSSDYL